MTAAHPATVYPGVPFIPPGITPMDPATSLWRAILLNLRNPLEAWPTTIYEEKIYRPPIPGLVFVMDPEVIAAVMLREAEGFPHGELFKRIVRPVWGKGILTADGAEWRWQRQAAAPAFRPDRLSTLVPAMTRAAEDTLERWRAAPNHRIDVMSEMSHITLDVVLDTILGGGDEFRGDQARAEINSFVAQLNKQKLSYMLPDAWQRWLPGTGSKMAAALRAKVGRMIENRRTAKARRDLVDLMIAATDPETGRAMSDALLVDNLLGFIGAGYETTAMALTWSLYLVGAHPPTALRLAQEVRTVAGNGPIGSEHIASLVLTKQILQEAMRLYPTPALVRQCMRRIEVNGVTIRKGERVFIPLYALHRHRLYWDNPNAFDPDRFAPGKPFPGRYIYMPFGAGPRICMGAAFAMMEATTVLATLARAVRLTPDPNHVIQPMFGFALRPQGGMPMTVSPNA